MKIFHENHIQVCSMNTKLCAKKMIQALLIPRFAPFHLQDSGQYCTNAEKQVQVCNCKFSERLVYKSYTDIARMEKQTILSERITESDFDTVNCF